MTTTFFKHYPQWSEHYYITPGPLSSSDTNSNHFFVNLKSHKLVDKKNGKSFTFYMKYEPSTSKILYCGRPANAVGKSVLLKSENGTLSDFYKKLEELDSDVAVYWFIQPFIGKEINGFI